MCLGAGWKTEVNRAFQLDHKDFLKTCMDDATVPR